MDHSRLTTIPLEVLFSIIGTLIGALAVLVSFIGKSIIGAVQRLQAESTKRGNQVSAIHTILGVICGKIGVDYKPPDP